MSAPIHVSAGGAVSREPERGNHNDQTIERTPGKILEAMEDTVDQIEIEAERLQEFSDELEELEDGIADEFKAPIQQLCDAINRARSEVEYLQKQNETSEQASTTEGA